MLNLEGRELGGCKLIRKIGEGGMGEVYLAEQRKVGNRQVAVKVMRPDPGAYGAEAVEAAKKRFEREAATLGKLEHPNILPVYDAGVEDDLYYIVMQYASDGSLADCIRGRSRRKLNLPLDVNLTSDFITQVASALQFTHDKGIVHRDVKPANVLTQEPVGGGWRLLLADFGVARGLDNTSQRTQVTGTFTYMAPEQFSGEYSPATDQYALAVMTYQLLAGRPPFEGELGAVMRAHMNEQPPSLRATNPNITAGVEAAVMRGLAKEPDQRFPSVMAFAQALKAGINEPAASIGGAVVNVAPPPLPASAAAPAGPTPHWPSGQSTTPPAQPTAKPPIKPDRSSSGLGRIWLVALAAVVLIVALVAGGIYANAQYQQSQTLQSTHATETAQAREATQTASAPTATIPVTATSTAPTSTASVGPTTQPPLPAGVNSTPIFDSVAPLCDTNDPVNWSKSNDAETSCPSASMTALVAKTQDTLACISADQGTGQSLPANGYLIAQVSSQSGKVELGFRQGVGNSQGSSYNITGYYIAVDTGQGQWVLYKVDDAGTTSTIDSGALPQQLPPTFYIAALFNGSTITVTVGYQTLPSVTDSSYGSGWVAACTSGSATFSHIQLYGLTQ